MSQPIGKVSGLDACIGDIVYGTKTGNRYRITGKEHDKFTVECLAVGPRAYMTHHVGKPMTSIPEMLAWANPFLRWVQASDTTSTTNDTPTTNTNNKENNIMSNAYDLATAAVREELDRQARAAAAEAVEKNLTKITKLVRKSKIGGVIRVHRPGDRNGNYADVQVYSRATDGRWSESTSSLNHGTDEKLIEHLVGVLAEGGKVERMVVAK